MLLTTQQYTSNNRTDISFYPDCLLNILSDCLSSYQTVSLLIRLSLFLSDTFLMITLYNRSFIFNTFFFFFFITIYVVSSSLYLELDKYIHNNIWIYKSFIHLIQTLTLILYHFDSLLQLELKFYNFLSIHSILLLLNYLLTIQILYYQCKLLLFLMIEWCSDHILLNDLYIH